MARTTINVEKEAHKEAKKYKRDDETWSDYILRCTEVEAVPKEELDFDDLVSGLEDSMDKISMANDPTTDIDVAGIMAEIKKAQELAEQARDNTEDLKAGLR